MIDKEIELTSIFDIDNQTLLIDPSKAEEILQKTEGHCPCIMKSARTEDTLCQCKEYKDEGICRCGWYPNKNNQTL